MKTAGLTVVQETIIDALNQENQHQEAKKLLFSESYIQAHSRKENF